MLRELPAPAPRVEKKALIPSIPPAADPEILIEEEADIHVSLMPPPDAEPPVPELPDPELMEPAKVSPMAGEGFLGVNTQVNCSCVREEWLELQG